MKSKTVTGNLIKGWLCQVDESVYENENVPKRKPSGPLLKWFQVDMSLDDKARFNLLTYPEYLEWCTKKLQEQEEKEESSDAKTFWANDTEKRSNVSSNDYEDFLSKNNVDISNSNTVNFDELAKLYNNN